jgi:hypothetical protein
MGWGMVWWPLPLYHCCIRFIYRITGGEEWPRLAMEGHAGHSSSRTIALAVVSTLSSPTKSSTNHSSAVVVVSLYYSAKRTSFHSWRPSVTTSDYDLIAKFHFPLQQFLGFVWLRKNIILSLINENLFFPSIVNFSLTYFLWPLSKERTLA